MRQPAADGAKATDTVQLCPGATSTPAHASPATPKAPASAPSSAAGPSRSVSLPVFRTMKGCGAEAPVPAARSANACAAGAIAPAGCTASPESATRLGPYDGTPSVPPNVPSVDGASTTVAVHVPPGASAGAQVCPVTRKPALAVGVPSAYGSAASFVMVIVAGSDGPPPSIRPKSCAAGETARSRPVPLSAAEVSVGPSAAICSAAVATPVASGSKATSTSHVAPGASGAPAPCAVQVSCVTVNWSAPDPVRSRP